MSIFFFTSRVSEAVRGPRFSSQPLGSSATRSVGNEALGVQNETKQAVPGGGARITSPSRVSSACGSEQSGGDLIRGAFRLHSWPRLTRSAFPATLLCMRPPSLRALLPDNLIEVAVTILSPQDCDSLRLGLGVFYWLLHNAACDVYSPSFRL